MYTTPPGVKGISVTAARAQLSDLVNRIAYGGEVVVLTRHGRPLAALLPVDDSGRVSVPPVVRPVGFRPSAAAGLPNASPDTIAAEYQRDRDQVDQH